MKTLAMIWTGIFAIMTAMSGLTFLGVFTLIDIMDSQHGTRVDFDNGKIFYSDQASPELAEELAAFLNQPANDSILADTTRIRLDHDGEQLRIAVCNQSITGAEFDFQLGVQLVECLSQSKTLANHKVEYQVCDWQFRPLDPAAS